jgi:predicted ATP-grasp superfamily ATP-dependent carboligase
MNIMVTDGENRSALAATRSLGKKGHNVFVTSASSESISSKSKFCKKTYKTPDPLTDGECYFHAIAEIVSNEKIDVIFPMTEQSVYILNKSKERLGDKVILACASSDKMEAVSNKFSLFQLAEKLGVDIPQTMYVTDVDDFLRKAESITVFPVVVKPAFSKIQEGSTIVTTGVMYAANPVELSCLYRTNPALRHPSMIQEMIVGEGTGLFTLFDKDRHRVLFSHRRLLEKPPSGGVSVLSESVPLDYEMVHASEKLLTAVGWTGIAMVEFKRDVRDGRAKLMEINGRFWGSLQLAVACNVDFPCLLLDFLKGEKTDTPIGSYLVGHKLKWFFGTLDHLLIRLKYDAKKLNLPPGSPSRLQAVFSFLGVYEKNTSFDVYDRNDSAPFWFEARSYIRQVLGIKR